MLGAAHTASDYLCIASLAYQKFGLRRHTRFSLEDRYIAIVEAVLAHEMSQSVATFRFFKRKGENTRSDLGQFVSLPLGFPFFHVSNLAFQLLYTLCQYKLVCLSIQCARLRADDSVVQFDNFALQEGSVTQVYCGLSNIARCFEAINGTLYSEKVNHENRLSVRE